MLQKLDMLPRKSPPLFWSDFIELRAIIHPDKSFSRGEFHGIYLRDKENAKPEKIESKWRDVLNFIATRQTAFGESYPFTISDDSDTVFFRVSADSLNQRIYIALLISSSLRFINKNRRSHITRSFEKICLPVFESLMPIGSEIRPTWASGGKEAPYTGTLYSKYSKIAEDIRCSSNFTKSDFQATDTGDGGLDIIAWHSMEDEREGIPIGFAQCGCTPYDWTSKQLEASPSKLRRQFPTMHPWNNFYFLPLDLRQSTGGWEYKSDIGEAIVVDRLRLLRIITRNNLNIHDDTIQFIQEVMEFTYH
jgi:hypothetical protein